MQMILVHRHTNELSSGNAIDFPQPVLHLLSKFLLAFLIFFILSALWILFQIAYYILLAPLLINELNKISTTCSLCIAMRKIILPFKNNNPVTKGIS